KMKQGDRQAPEGFYTITPGQMNPNSSYYLSFNIGYPNAYDRSYGRSGSQLMVHGDCSSAGCYAMTDDQIGEIYALARESFFGGQEGFQLTPSPFHMAALKAPNPRNTPLFVFGKNQKRGHPPCGVPRPEQKVNVCDRHYVFDAEGRNGATLKFDAAGRCPA